MDNNKPYGTIAIQHVGVFVHNLEESAKWYHDIFGFEIPEKQIRFRLRYGEIKDLPLAAAPDPPQKRTVPLQSAQCARGGCS